MSYLFNSSWEQTPQPSKSFVGDSLAVYYDLITFSPRYKEVLETLDIFEKVVVHGRVTDKFGLPVAGATVEVWHPEKWGMFAMAYGPSPAPVDADGQGWMCCATNDQGEYFFTIEKRNEHGAGLPSVNFKVTTSDQRTKLTKLYFGQNEMELADPYLMDLEVEERYQHFGWETDGACQFDIEM